MAGSIKPLKVDADGKPARGTRWRAYYRDPQGRSRSKTFDTKGDAQRFLADLSSDSRRGKWADPALSRVTFEVWADDWFATKATWSLSMRASTEKRYRKHVRPFFEGRRIGEIDRITVKRFIAGMVTAGYSPKYVRAAVSIVHGVFELAREAHAVHDNPASRQGLPETVKKPPMFLTPDQVRKLVEAIDREPYALAALLLAYTGLRPSEMCGLRVGAVDLLRRRVHVVETLSIVNGRLVEGPTKTKKHRTVPLPPFLADELGVYLADRRGRSARVPAPAERLFVGLKSAQLRETWFQQAVIRPAAEAVGLRGLRAYDLRHTYASMMIANGTHPKAVQERMGHEKIAQTMDTYGHLFEALEAEATDALDRTWRAAQAEPGEPEAEVVSLAERRPGDPGAEAVLEAAPGAVGGAL